MISYKKRFKRVLGIWFVIELLVFPFLVSLNINFFDSLAEKIVYIFSQSVFLLVIAYQVEHILLVTILKIIDNFRLIDKYSYNWLKWIGWLLGLGFYSLAFIEKEASLVFISCVFINYFTFPVMKNKELYYGDNYLLLDMNLIRKKEVLDYNIEDKKEIFRERIKKLSINLTRGNQLNITSKEDIINKIILKTEIE